MSASSTSSTVSLLRDYGYACDDVSQQNKWELRSEPLPSGTEHVHLIKYQFVIGSNPESNTEEGPFRGAVIYEDVQHPERNTLLCHTYMAAKQVPSNQYRIPRDSYITRGLDGVTLRVFLFNNTIHISSHNSLNIESSRSRYGNAGVTFYESFVQGFATIFGIEPTSESVRAALRTWYPENVTCSPYVFVFLLSSPEVMMASKQPLGSLSFVQMLEMPRRGIFSKQVNPDLIEDYRTDEQVFGLYANVVTFDLHESLNYRKLYVQQPMNLPDALQFLHYGFYPEGINYARTSIAAKLNTGEFLWVREPSGMFYRVESESYRFRSDIRNNSPNVVHRMYELLDEGRLYREKTQGFLAKYPKVAQLSLDDFNQVGPVFPVHTAQPAHSFHHDNRKNYVVFACLYHSVPSYFKNELLQAYRDVYSIRIAVSNWIYEIYKNKSYEAHRKHSNWSAVIRIIDGSAHDDEFVVQDNIKNYVMKEYGWSLYKTRKLMESERERAARLSSVQTSTSESS